MSRVIDPSSCRVSIGDEIIQFTKAQFCVFHALVRAKGRVLSFGFLNTILEDCTGQESECRALTVHICRVRKSLERHGIKFINLKDVGYSINRWDFEVMQPSEEELAA
jgi:DNA-binding response OmpR family regulator